MSTVTFPPTGPTTVLNQIPAYLYVQYNDDQNVQSFFDAYNAYAQGYLNYLNTLNLPIYTNGNIAGALLDWVLTGLYGFPRPGLPASGTFAKGEFNTYRYNTFQFNQTKPAVTPSFTATSDDTYKRCATWRYYRGDGVVFTIPWLKRRIVRFLTGIAGTDPGVSTTYIVSITYTGFKTATITLSASTEATIFASAVSAGILELPFQTTWTVVT